MRPATQQLKREPLKFSLYFLFFFSLGCGLGQVQLSEEIKIKIRIRWIGIHLESNSCPNQWAQSILEGFLGLLTTLLIDG